MQTKDIRVLKDEVHRLCTMGRREDAIQAVHDAFGDEKFQTVTHWAHWWSRGQLLHTLYEGLREDAHSIYEHTGQTVSLEQFRYWNEHGDDDLADYFNVPFDLGLVGEALDMIDVISREAPQYYDFSRGIQGVYHIHEDDIIDLIEAYGKVIKPPHTIRDLRNRTEALWDDGEHNRASRYLARYLVGFDDYAWHHHLESQLDLVREIQGYLKTYADDKSVVARLASQLRDVREQDAYLYRVDHRDDNNEKPRPAQRDEVFGAFREHDKIASKNIMKGSNQYDR